MDCLDGKYVLNIYQEVLSTIMSGPFNHRLFVKRQNKRTLQRCFCIPSIEHSKNRVSVYINENLKKKQS